MWIEIFKTGRHTSSNGQEIEFTTEDLDRIANEYEQRVKQTPFSLAPLVKGHPTSDAPAYGWVEKLARRGNFLLAKLKDLSQEIVEEVRQKKYQRVSISLTKDFRLQHIGLLGASNPAVDGLLPISFVDFDNFDEFYYQHNEDSLSFVVEQNKKLKDQIDYFQQEIINRDLLEFTSSLVDQRIISPTLQKNTFELLKLANQIDQNSSEKIDLLEKMQSFLTKLRTTNLTTEFASKNNVKIYENLQTKFNFNNNREELHKAILEYLDQNPNLSYEEALNKIINQ